MIKKELTTITAKLVHNGAALLLSLCAIVLLSGCASTVANRSLQADALAEWDSNAPEALIATELISVLMQLPEHAPWSTTVSLSTSKSQFGASIENVLRISGYGVQRVSEDQGYKYVSHSKSNIVSNATNTTRYTIKVGRISISRDYETSGDLIFPTSLVTIKGILPKKIVLNDDLYRQRGGNRTIPNGVIFKSLDDRVIDSSSTQVVVNNNARKDPDEQFSHQRFLVLAKSRLFLDSKLTAAVDIRDWIPVRQVLLVFPTRDNLVLGQQNKSAIKKLVQFYDPNQTGFGITGCKRHNSLLWDGTESESLERQLRVRNELLVAGVNIARIRENGCFANEFDAMLERNSVMLTLRERR